LFQGSLNYLDKRLKGYDVATLIEVIEHLDQSRLDSLQRVLFEFAKPKTIIITTPNVEYNQLFESLAKGKFRHHDHRFEWSRNQFQNWANEAAKEFGYEVSFDQIGPYHEIFGAPTQVGVFKKND
jgi:hypothetical protein